MAVRGKTSVVQIHSARTQNRHTIHVAADAAGLLPICRPVSRVPLQSPFQRKDQPPSPFPLSVFPPPTWSHMGPSCPLLPPAPIFHDGLSAPHVGQAMPILRAMEAVTLQNLFLLFNSKGSSSKCCSSVGLCDTSPCSVWVFSVFRRTVTCSTRFFLACQSIRTTIRLEHSSWQMLLSITPASTV